MKKWFFVVVVYLFGGNAFAQQYKSFPMWNDRLPVEQRVKDLIGRLTLEEKVSQMLNSSPAVDRLGIPGYDWWNETLHGVARTPFNVTSYPQAIGMAATWDTASIRLMGDYSATEGRAIYKKSVETGKEKNRYVGLTYWTPNINIFRDPRWGRGQETYGEDPFLTSQMGASFVNGLQGNDPKYLKAVACAKHYAVHSGPESSRHSDNFNPSLYDLWDTYLPAFRKLVVDAKVAGVMCAYNAIGGEPCCANTMLTDILRKQWKFTGYVTSDCGALDDFFAFHKTHKDALTAAADALVHTTDLECGNNVYRRLVDAVKQGLIKESAVDASLMRLFEIRYRLGMFDPAEKVPYANTPVSVLESPRHKALALKMARQSIVLLKNANNILPFSKQIKKIAVLGPNADNKVAVLGNYNGMPSRVVSVLEGIKKKLGNDVEVLFEKGVNFTDDSVMDYKDITGAYSINGKKGVQVEYFNNELLQGNPTKLQLETDIDRYWAEGQEPAPGVSPKQYSVRFTTFYKSDITTNLELEVNSNSGYKVLVDGKVIVDQWDRRPLGSKLFSVAVQQGKSYKIEVAYHRGEGIGSVYLKSGRKVKPDMKKLAQKVKSADAIVYVGGISPQLEGEEMPVAVPGFKGGDRTTIQLPEVQSALLKELAATGKPLAFVMMTGSALAIPGEDAAVPAILNAWYGGQSAGTAVADVLFGDYNPAGRLPITFYKSDKDLPDFTDYSMENRTYRYFKGIPQYPFGFGLSYTKFSYAPLNIPAQLQKGRKLPVSVRVTNVGKRDGEEVVQLYVSHKNSKQKAPIRALKGFQRIYLKSGETKTIQFQLSPEQLSLVNETGQSYQKAGTLVISVGGGQPDVKNTTSGNVVSKTISVR